MSQTVSLKFRNDLERLSMVPESSKKKKKKEPSLKTLRWCGAGPCAVRARARACVYFLSVYFLFRKVPSLMTFYQCWPDELF